MLIWGSSGYAGGLTSEIVTMDECLYISEQVGWRYTVDCLPLEKPDGRK